VFGCRTILCISKLICRSELETNIRNSGGRRSSLQQ
jgi:hypothetical protein